MEILTFIIQMKVSFSHAQYFITEQLHFTLKKNISANTVSRHLLCD